MIGRFCITMAAACLAACVTQPLQAQSVSRSSRSTGAIGGLAPTAAERSSSGQYAPSELENLRTQLLNLSDTVAQFAAVAPSEVADMDSLQQARSQIQVMSYPYLNTLRQGISPSKLNARLTLARQSLAAYNDARAQAASKSGLQPRFTDSTPFPTITYFCQSQGSSVSGSQSTSGFGASGAQPPSVSTQNPSPGQDVSMGGSNVTDPETLRIQTGIVLAADVVRFVADTVKDLSQDACKEDILGFNASLACLIVDALAVVADAVDEGIHFCDDDLTGHVIDASFVGLGDVHNDLLSIGTGLDNHITTANTDIDSKISTATTTINASISAADLDIDTRIAALDAHVANEFSTLTSIIRAATNEQVADLQQIMKLELTPDGLKAIIPSILTCDGTAQNPCPAPLAVCQANGNCSWNNVGPLP